VTHTVDTRTCPAAAEPLAALYLATRARPVSGTEHRPDRLKLALAVGAKSPLGDLLGSPAPVLVRPRGRDVWEVVGQGEGSGSDAAVLDLIRREAESQGLTPNALGKKAGLGAGHPYKLLRGAGPKRALRWETVLRLLAALGKPLSWAAAELERGVVTPAHAPESHEPPKRGRKAT
jgi:hypothetical protein